MPTCHSQHLHWAHIQTYYIHTQSLTVSCPELANLYNNAPLQLLPHYWLPFFTDTLSKQSKALTDLLSGPVLARVNVMSQIVGNVLEHFALFYLCPLWWVPHRHLTPSGEALLPLIGLEHQLCGHNLFADQADLFDGPLAHGISLLVYAFYEYLYGLLCNSEHYRRHYLERCCCCHLAVIFSPFAALFAKQDWGQSLRPRQRHLNGCLLCLHLGPAAASAGTVHP